MLVIFCTSCDKFSITKKTKIQQLDTIVDYTSVDFYPSFTICDSLIDKDKKSDCFRRTIHQKIGAELLKYSLSIKDSIDETVFVDLIINSKGTFVFKELQASEEIKNHLPELDSLLRFSVGKLPTIRPAVKRGIPVTTKYRLPIRILLKD